MAYIPPWEREQNTVAQSIPTMAAGGYVPPWERQEQPAITPPAATQPKPSLLSRLFAPLPAASDVENRGGNQLLYKIASNPILNAPGRLASKALATLTSGRVMQAPKPAENTLEKAMDFGGMLTGEGLKWGTAYGTVGKLAGGAKVLGKLAPKARGIATLAAKGGASGIAVGAGEAALEGGDAGDVAKRAALYGGMGAVGDPLLEKAVIPLAKAGIQKVAPKLFAKPAMAAPKVEVVDAAIGPQRPQERLALPPGQDFTVRDLTHDEMIGRVIPKRPLQLPPGSEEIVKFNNRVTRNAPLGTLKRSDNAFKQAEQELTQGIETLQNYVRHNDILAAYPPGTTIEAAMADAQKATGVNLQQLLDAYEKAQKLQATPLEGLPKVGLLRVRMANIAGVEAPPKLAKLDPLLQFKQQIPQPFERPGITPLRPPAEEKPLLFKTTIKVPRDGAVPPLTPKPLNVAAGSGGNVPPIVPPAAKVAAEASPLYNPADIKDVSGFRAYTQDVGRNFRDVFGPHFESVKKAVLDPFDRSKGASVDMQRNWTTRLKTEIVDGLGIKKGSRESALVQQFGEKKITEDELKRRSPDKWENIKEADKWFRKVYDQLLEEVNVAREKIYPNVEKHMAEIEKKIAKVSNDPKMSEEAKKATLDLLADEKEAAFRGKRIPKREDYYRHFQELSDSLGGLRNIFDTPAGIDPKLAGVSDFTQPMSKYLSFAQKRGLGPFKNDAVGGFLNYLPAASNAIHIDPHIKVFRELAKDVAANTGETRNANNFIEYVRDFANDLAGKTNPFDRAIQKVIPGGRVAFNGLRWLNNRVKANVILGNAGSALSQIANVPQGIAFAKQYSVPGLGRTLASIVKPNMRITQSPFMKERFAQGMYRQFDTGLLQQPKKFAIWMMEGADHLGTAFIWNSAHAKAVAEKVANPIKYADDVTRRMVAGRGVGEVPLLQKSQVMQIVAPFQVEVGNLWNVQRDFVKAKDFGALATLYLANFMFNRGMEQVRGSGVVFDPIDAMMDALAEEDTTVVQKAGRLAGEVLSNVPLGQTVAALYPEYGTTMLGKELPTRKELMGRQDPTRYGSGVVSIEALKHPLTRIAPPFGGMQAEKTLKGLNALNKDAVYDQEGKKMKYPILPSTSNQVKGLLFGTGGFPETREYYDQNRRSLSEDQTKDLLKREQRGYSTKAGYEALMLERKIDNLGTKINLLKKQEKAGELTREERLKKQREIEAQQRLLRQERIPLLRVKKEGG